MTASVTSDNSVFVLYPPRVSGQTQPVVGAHVGVPIVAYDLVTDGAGAYVEVDPPLSGTLIPGDEIKLWLKGESVLLSFVDIVDPNATILLRIPRGRLHPDRINELFYTIERNSQNIAESVVLAIVYNRIRPGLRDRMDVPGGHSELKLQLPDAIKNGVGPDFVSAQVCVSYPYCRAYDRITLSCNGELLHANVGAGQAPQPPNPGSEVPITVCFTVTRVYLDKAKRLDKKLDFRFTVTDQIGNGPDTNEPWSPLHSVDEDLDGTRLPMPILLERMEDFPGDDASIIELGKLAGGPLLVVVVTADNRFQVGDKVEAVYTGKLVGQPDVVVTVSGTVEADPFGQKKPCVLNVSNDKVVASSDVTVTYALRRSNGDLVGNSKVANAKVTGEAAPDLKAPSIKEASGSSLDPLAALNSLTAVVDAGLKVGDIITVTWTGAAGAAAGGSHTAPPKTVQGVGPQEIALPVSVLAFNLGKTVTVTYTVTRAGQTTPSPPLTLSVQSLPQSVLVKPTIIQAANNGEGAELDVSSLTSATSRMGVWPLMALGQPVWMTATGTNADGSPYRKVIWTPPAATSANWIRDKFASAGIALAELRNLKHGSALSLQFKAGLDGSTVENAAVPFPLRTYAVIAVEDVKPTITSVKGSPSNVEIPNSSSTTETSVILTGAASKGQRVQVLDGTTDKGQPVADPVTGVWTLTVTGLSVAAHSFTAKALYGAGQTSAARTLTVTAVVAPTITSLKGSPSNVEIPNGNSTTETSVILTGAASKGQKVQILDGTASKGEATADATTGVWTLTVASLAVGPHSFTAKALYGAGQTSAARTLTVTAVVAPTITSLKGSPSNVEIPNGNSTTETSVILTGAASKGQKVQILDGTASKGEATADATTGVWTLTVASLAVGAHSFTAKALYGAGQTSAARTVTVTAVVAPTITSLKGSPSNVEIPNGSSTTETSVILTGAASKGQKVQILDGTASKGEATADATTGVWTLTVASLAVGPHSFTAKALYGAGQTSAARTLRVEERPPIGTIIGVVDPTFVVFNSSGTRAYVSSKSQSKVFVIDATKNTVITSISTASGPEHLVISPDDKLLYVACSAGYAVDFIDVGTNTRIRSIADLTPLHLSISPSGRHICCSGGWATILDALTGSIVSRFKPKGNCRGGGFSKDGARLFVSGDGDTSEPLYVLNATNYSQLAPIPVPGLRKTEVYTTREYGYVIHGFSIPLINVVSLAANALVKTLTVGRPVLSLSISVDGSRIYVCSQTGGEVEVIDTSTHALMKSIASSPAARHASVTPDNKRLYICEPTLNSIKVVYVE